MITRSWLDALGTMDTKLNVLLKFGLANAINNHLRLKIRVVCAENF